VVGVERIKAGQPRPTKKNPANGRFDFALVLHLFRASAVASVAALGPKEAIAASAAAFAKGANAAGAASHAGANAASAAGTNVGAHAALTAADDAVSAYAYAPASAALAADCRFLSSDTPSRLFEQTLWLSRAPSSFSESWDNARRSLLALDQGFDIWIAWYEAGSAGSPLTLSSR
jgi:hypothetical protein